MIRHLIPICLLIVLPLGVCDCAENAQPSADPPVIIKRVLDDGLTAIIKPEPGSGLVAVVAMVKVGANQETNQNSGIGSLVTQLLLAGTIQSSAEEVAAIADECGGNISTFWEPDFAQIRLVTTTAMFNRAMTLMGEALTGANFEQKWVEKVRRDLLQRAGAANDDLFEDSYSTLRGLLYEDNGYHRPNSGSLRTFRLATPDDLMKFYSSYYVPNNMVISIVGDVTVNQAMDRVRKAFAGVMPQRLPMDRGVPDEKLERSKLHASEVDIPTAYLMLGWLAPSVKSPDYAAAAVAANALGGGKGSLMFRELRQKRGMGYDVGVMYPRNRYQGHIMAYIITDPFKASFGGGSPSMILDDVKAALLQQVETLKNAPLSQADLDRAKGYTIGSHALSHQRAIDRAYELAWLEAAGLGYESYVKFPEMIETVTAEDVQRVAKKYFTNYAAVLLLPKTGQAPSEEKAE